ncbi:hypothetical protein FEM48_Zijuj02G0021300 [Ziziphus jujuba var. spinosa]|uniref:Uncharacterized protein n=1 Tax=Ziziphus jujuba var. spinosa TaxID=714518 RepID=A0A978VT02_ZIZJJ|nr:hypothetical protein FEM48_Zijuj02G0021300 [Ziziphus jujuba var. spinosa]
MSMAVALYSMSATGTPWTCRRLNPTTELGRSDREEGSGRKLRLAQAVQGTYYGFRIGRRR